MISHISTRTLQTKQLVIILYVDKPGNHNVHVMIMSFVKDWGIISTPMIGLWVRFLCYKTKDIPS